MRAVGFGTQSPGPVTERTVVVRFQRSPAGGRTGGTGPDTTVGGGDVGAVGRSGRLLPQPATLWASTTTRIPANVLIASFWNQHVPSRGEGGKISTASGASLRGYPGTSQVFSKRAVVRICFGPFTLDRDTRQLTTRRAPVHLAPKAFQLLVMLAEDRPKVISKAALQERLWPQTFVAEANLSNLVAEIREALGDRGRTPTWIRTAHGSGYAFSGPAVTVTPHPETTADRPLCWLEMGPPALSPLKG